MRSNDLSTFFTPWPWPYFKVNIFKLYFLGNSHKVHVIWLSLSTWRLATFPFSKADMITKHYSCKFSFTGMASAIALVFSYFFTLWISTNVDSKMRNELQHQSSLLHDILLFSTQINQWTFKNFAMSYKSQ